MNNITFEEIVEVLPGNIYWLNREGIFLGCNKNMLNAIGLEKIEDYIGKTYEDLYEITHIQKIKETDRKVIENDETIILEEIAFSSTKGTSVYLTQKSPLHNKAGKVIGLVGMSIDITEKKKTEEALKKAKEQIAKEQIKGMELVSAGIAHELRTPLAAITMGAQGIEQYLQILLDAYQLTKKHNLPIKFISDRQIDQLAKTLTDIKDEINHANIVINMLLVNLSVGNSSSISVEKLLMSECIDKSLSQYVFSTGNRQLVHLDIADDFFFMGNETLMIHIIFNLLKNSSYFISKINKGEIYISLKTSNDYNELHFKDTAQGIAKEDMPFIFDQFFTRGTHHGSGIGLAFCKAVIESWKGKITCYSTYGQFAEFVFFFPSVKVIARNV